MVEGVVEVEAVACCAGDIACPIAVASALERAPILTVTDDDDWDNGGELFIAILTKQMHFVLCKQCHTARNSACSRSLLILQHYFVYNVYRTRPPAVRVRVAPEPGIGTGTTSVPRYAHAENRKGDL